MVDVQGQLGSTGISTSQHVVIDLPDLILSHPPAQTKSGILSKPTTSLILTTMAAPSEFLQYIDDKADAFIQRLADAVGIPSYVTFGLLVPVKRQRWLNDGGIN